MDRRESTVRQRHAPIGKLKDISGATNPSTERFVGESVSQHSYLDNSDVLGPPLVMQYQPAFGNEKRDKDDPTIYGLSLKAKLEILSTEKIR